MRKLAVILALSLVLELITPMQIYAQANGTNPIMVGNEATVTRENSDVSLDITDEERIFSETETVSDENVDENGIIESKEDDCIIVSENESETNSVENETLTETFENEEREVDIVETAENESESEVEENAESEVASDAIETEISEPETETMGPEKVGNIASTEKTLSMNEVSVLSVEVTDISEQVYLHLPEVSYPYENKGYPLTATFLLPQELVDTKLTITEVTVSVDGEEPRTLEPEEQYISSYQWNEYGNISFYGGYDASIDVGKHSLTYTLTYTFADTVYYMSATTEATFAQADEGMERVYYDIDGVEFIDYFSTKKGTEILKICTSYIDYRSETEKITNVQLRNSSSGEIADTTFFDLESEEETYKKSDSRYRGTYNEEYDTYVSNLLPEEYYYRWGRVALCLNEDIEEGLYDIIITTDAGYTHVYDTYYMATESTVLYSVMHPGYTEAKEVLLWPDNAGEYVSVFVYGVNLTEENIPVFYNDTKTRTLTEYDEDDPFCAMEWYTYGMDITLKKKDIHDTAWELSDSENYYKELNVEVPEIDIYQYWGSESVGKTPYYAQMVYRYEYVEDGNYSIKPGLRMYLSSYYVQEGDKIRVEGEAYKNVSGEFEVLFNGLEYYIHIPADSKLYTNVYYYIITNLRSQKVQTMWIYEPHEPERYQDNITVPANCTWEIHGIRDVGNILYRGTTTKEEQVLTPGQIIDLSQYGKLRVCVYDSEGMLVERYITFLRCSEYYSVDFVLNDTNDEPASMENVKTYYFMEKGLELEVPVRENYTFGGWYSDAKLTKKVTKIAPGSKGDKTLYAKWTPDTYTIVYNANGGNGKVKTTSWKHKESVEVAVNTFTRPGYVFKGWNAKKDGTGTAYAEKQVLSKINENGKKQLTLYAIWEPLVYTLVLNKNNAEASDGTLTASPAYIEMVFGDTITLTGQEYFKKGYTISSWNTKPNGKGKKYSNGEIGSLTKNKDDIVMLYAQWALEKYTLTYDYKGGKVTSKNPASYTYETAEIVLKEPKRTGYLFDGFYEVDPDSDEFTGKEEKISVITKGSTGNKKLYAKWTPVTYTVILNKNAQEASYGSIVDESDAVKNCVYDEESYVLTGDEYVWDGKEIVAWTTKPNGKGKKYVNGKSLKNLSKNNGENIVLYAQWAVETFDIQYEGVEGIKNKNPLSYTYHETDQMKLKTLSRKGYVFGGWYMTSTEQEENRIEYIDRSLKKDIVICAKWKPISYNVCLKPNASDATVKQGLSQLFSVDYGQNFVLEADAYTREHYKIAYWTTNSKGSGIKYKNGTVSNLSTKDGSLVNLYPKWELEQYPIVYENTDFENVTNKNPLVYTYNKEVKLKNPTRTGYVFGGWYAEDTTKLGFDPQKAEKLPKIAKGSEGMIRVYAYWKPLTYYVQITANSQNAMDGSVIIGSTAEKQKITAGEALVFAKDTYVREGYRLTGFSEKKNGKGKVYSLESEQYIYGKKESTTVKLYAVWEKVAPKKVTGVEVTIVDDTLTVSFTPNEGMGYYEIEYSDSISMRNAKKMTLNQDDQTVVSISGLASQKRYYVRVREVQTDSCQNTIYGSWSQTVNILK